MPVQLVAESCYDGGDQEGMSMPEPKIAQRSPYVCDQKPGRVAWCACGHSANQPYCDGSHGRLNTGITPIVVEVAEERKVAWCGCKHSGNKPYCDGTHSKLVR